MLKKPRLVFPRLINPENLLGRPQYIGSASREGMSLPPLPAQGVAQESPPPYYTPTPTQGVPRHWSAPVQKLGEVLGSGLCAPTVAQG